MPPELASRDSFVHPSLSSVARLRNHYGTQSPLSMHITFAQTISYLNFHKRLCTGIADSRLSPLQYFLASTVYNGRLCAQLFPQEDSKSLEGQDDVFLFIIHSRAWFLAHNKGSVNIAYWTLRWDRWRRRKEMPKDKGIHDKPHIFYEIICH